MERKKILKTCLVGKYEERRKILKEENREITYAKKIYREKMRKKSRKKK